jgi:hypothetical protein
VAKSKMERQVRLARVDRWPDEELPQLRTKPAAVEEPLLMNTRTIIMVIIMFMALLAVLIGVTVHRRSSYRMVLSGEPWYPGDQRHRN